MADPGQVLRAGRPRSQGGSRRRVSLLCSFLLLVSTIVSAETIRFDPPNPTGSRSVDAIVTGVWPNGCLPIVKSVVIASTTITLHLDATPPPGVCTQSLVPYTRTFHMGIAPPGGYTVILVADAGSTSTELARVPFIVRDAETMNIFPYALPTTGGQIGLSNPFFLAGATLTIDGVTVPADSNVDGALFANAPPHAPGAVDITINSTAGTVTSKAALIYYDPATPDPAVFEPILFPVSFAGPGALGSQWLTENFIVADATLVHFRDPLPCAFCSRTPRLVSKQLINNGNPWGHVLYAMRGTTEGLYFASRIRDTSRQAQTAGTEVPVVRESDFRGQLRFLNVPTDPRYRITLRLWSLGDSQQFFVIATSAQVGQPLTVSRIAGTSMWFATMDVTRLLPGALLVPTDVTVAGASNPLYSPLIWGMLSITNNDTQQVTIITPH